MTFKKAEMAKTLKNGLSMIETNPLNHNWSDFMILTGLTLHQFQKKLLLSFTYTIEMFVLFSELLGLTWRRKNMDELSWLLQWLASMETLAKQIIGDEWRLILIFTQNFASNKTNASCIHCIQISLIADFRLDIVKK